MRAFNFCRLKAPPSNRCLRETPPALVCRSSPRASMDTGTSYTLERTGASTHPCLIPTVTGKGTELSDPLTTVPTVPVWRARSIETNIDGQPNLLTTSSSASLFTVSNAFCRLTWAFLKGALCSLLFSSSWWRTKLISAVLQSALKPHCESRRTTFATCSLNRASRILAKILLATPSRERLYSHWNSRTFHLFSYILISSLPVSSGLVLHRSPSRPSSSQD